MICFIKSVWVLTDSFVRLVWIRVADHAEAARLAVFLLDLGVFDATRLAEFLFQTTFVPRKWKLYYLLIYYKKLRLLFGLFCFGMDNYVFNEYFCYSCFLFLHFLSTTAVAHVVVVVAVHDRVSGTHRIHKAIQHTLIKFNKIFN